MQRVSSSPLSLGQASDGSDNAATAAEPSGWQLPHNRSSSNRYDTRPAPDITISIPDGEPSSSPSAASPGATSPSGRSNNDQSYRAGSLYSSKMRRTDSVNSIAMHYFVEQKKLDMSSVSSQLADGPESGSIKEAAEPVIAKRIYVHTKMHINTAICLALLAVLTLSYYNSTMTILRLKRWYAAVVLVLVPIGVYFFSFAVNTAVCGVFSLFLGKHSEVGQLH